VHTDEVVAAEVTEYWPALHDEQAVVPVLVANCPARQTEQAEAPEAEYWPTLQEKQLDAPAVAVP